MKWLTYVSGIIYIRTKWLNINWGIDYEAYVCGIFETRMANLYGIFSLVETISWNSGRDPDMLNDHVFVRGSKTSFA